MNENIRFDHAVIVVPELEQAISNFEALGFNVQRGGSSKPAHNALIYFSDGTYIELITLVSRPARLVFRFLYVAGILGLAARRTPTIRSRFILWFGGPTGLRDWCVRCSSLDNTIEHLRARGIETFDGKYFSRKKPDGEVAKWRLAGPANKQLPFLIEDISPTQIRVPYENNSNHANGATGIAAVILHPTTGRQVIQSLQLSSRENSNHTTACKMGNVDICLAEQPSAAHIALELHCSGPKKGPLCEHKTFGAQISLM